MKKLIVLSVVFALVATAAFAVDLSASVFGLVVPVQSDNSEGAEIKSSGGFQRARFDGYGEVADGEFGGWIRFGGSFNAYAFWKPADWFKMVIGGNPDGMYGKEGVTGWMLHENPYDAGVAIFGGNVWGGGMTPSIKTRDAFYGGYGDNALHLNFNFLENMIGLNLILPFWGDSWAPGHEISDMLGNITAQLDLNLAFGNIAITFDSNKSGDDTGGKVYAYLGMPIGPLGLDFGVGYGFNNGDNNEPIAIGLGLKFAADAFGIRFRAVTTVGDAFNLLAELVPYFAFTDKITAFLGIGVGYAGAGYDWKDYSTDPATTKHTDDGTIDFYVNPYVRIGEEWGAQFLVGFQLYSKQGLSGDYSTINWALPIAIMLSF